MKIKSVIIFSLILWTISCNNNQEVQEPVSDTDTSETIKAEEDEDQIRESNSDERSNWQKPRLVIDQLGDIDDKVVADIGAGALGYFVFRMLRQSQPNSIIAIDIDAEAVDMLERLKNALDEDMKEKLDVRLALPDDSKLKDGEVDRILMVNTIGFISNPEPYLEHLYTKLAPDGKIVIVDFKTKRIPEDIGAPEYKYRPYLHTIEESLYEAGYHQISADDTSLEYQYIITAVK